MGAGGRGLGRWEGREVVNGSRCCVIECTTFSKAVMAAGISLDTADIEFFYYPTRPLIKWDSGVVTGLFRRVFMLQYLSSSQGAARWTPGLMMLCTPGFAWSESILRFVTVQLCRLDPDGEYHENGGVFRYGIHARC